MVYSWVRQLSLMAKDRRGQDLIEYAMLAGFLAVAVGAVFPSNIGPGISQIMSKCASIMTQAGNQG
ncbi:MAG: hypothetical protein IT163_01205 [Bryobacterales bacterium]|nr:hypothetical protein [Bryobacterales bacterium]